MKKQLSMLLIFFVAIISFSSCSNKKDDDTEVPNEDGMVVISGEIKTNTTWTADKIYLLKGFVYVSNNAVLTIEPGTIIKGDKSTKGTLIITRGAQIQAVGTVDKPIVFTSAQAVGGRAQGDWGGVILLGKAPVNQGNDVKIEGGLTAPPGATDDKPYFYYGGTVPNDNSGTLKYVRIEFAGIPFSPDNEINGLTMGGVGSGTTIDYVEVYRSGDDSFEWFGGTVTCKHLLSIGAWDDDFDTDFGFSGKVQFGLAQRAQVVADYSGSNGFESDNDAYSTVLTPKTSAIFSNMTIVGPMLSTSTSGINANFQHGAQIRRNSSLSLFNSIIANYPEGIYIDDSWPALPAGNTNAQGHTTANFTAGSLVVKNNLIFNCNAKSNEVKGTDATSKVIFEASLRADNTFDATNTVTALLTDPLKYGGDFKVSGNANYGTPNFTVKAGSAAAAGALFSDPKFSGDQFFDKTVAYKGAFGSTDWTTGWASYDPQNLSYTAAGAVK